VQLSRHFVLFFLFLFPLSTAISRSSYVPFEPYSAAWFATHIVVATEGDDIDGKLFVLESWKGDLKEGDELFLPELAGFKELSLRKIKSSIEKQDSDHKDLGYVSCSRMILFLTEKNDSEKTTGENAGLFIERETKITQRQWESLNEVHQDAMPVIWIEHEKPYIFEIARNFSEPKDNQSQRAWFPSWKTETIIKKNIIDLQIARDAMGQALKLSDLEKRAEALEPLTQTHILPVNAMAILALKPCGKAASSVLKRMMNDLTRMDYFMQIYRVVDQIESEELDNELIRIIREERDFVKSTGIIFDINWLGELAKSQNENLRHRVLRFSVAVTVMKTRLKISRQDDVNEVLDFIEFHPELGNNLKQIQIELESFRTKLNK
jgi:hypothetical protein